MKEEKQGYWGRELIILLAIIVILAAAAYPAYQDYIEKAKMAEITARYHEAILEIKSTMRRGATQRSLNLIDTTPSDVPEWIGHLRSKAENVGASDVLFARNADATLGVIGVDVNGAALSMQVTISLPRYAELKAISETINAADAL